MCSPFLLAPLTSSVFGQNDFSRTVLPITPWHLKPGVKLVPPDLDVDPRRLLPKLYIGVEIDYGTGFCLDPECRLIGTNYHVAAIARPRKIKGQKVTHCYLATGPNDEGATSNGVLSPRALKYAPIRDLAIFELRHPLPQHHGAAFSLKDLEMGQRVRIYAYPTEVQTNRGNIKVALNRKLQEFYGTFKGHSTADGLLAFEYGSWNGKPIRGGASGGLVVDTETQQVVGVLSRVGLGKNGKPVALAVPIQSLADFVNKVQPWLASRIFPSANKEVISPTLVDLHPKVVWPHAADSLQRRSDESAEVKLLREKAQRLADSMRDFVAVQTLTWGSGEDNVPVAIADYEVKVLGGYQRFRKYPYGKEELQDVPFPPVNTVILPGGEWSELPQMVGTALGLKIHQFDDVIVNGRRTKVFQYRAETEDAVCNFKSVLDLVFYSISKVVTVPCYGEVWTDQDTNILRISEHLELHGKWRNWQGVVTYGWLRKDVVPRLIPLTISIQAELKNKLYWCRGQFTNYRIYMSQSKFVVSDDVQSLPP